MTQLHIHLAYTNIHDRQNTGIDTTSITVEKYSYANYLS